jgi:hypothetical protein
MRIGLAIRVLAVGLLPLLIGSACAAPDPQPSMAPASASTAAAQASHGGTDGPSADAAAAWTRGPDAPLALTEVAAAAHRGRIWVAGGLSADGQAVDRVLVLDPTTGTWSDGPPLAQPVHHSSLVSDGTALWLLGGYIGNTFDQPTDAVWTLDTSTAEATWTPGPPLPEPRAAGAAVWDGSRLVYGGGVGPGVLSELVFAGGVDGFEPVARLSLPREHLAAASDGGGRSWFLGGRAAGLEGNLARVDRLEGDTLEPIGDLPTPRGGVAAFHWPALGACLVGGESPDGANAQVECMGDAGVTVLPELGEARHGLGAAVVDGRAYVLLGGPVPGLTVSATVEELVLP